MYELETPPHAWGRRATDQMRAITGGNTPTCVGKTRSSRTRDASIWKHPHMRGEDLPISVRLKKTSETPPHAWGRREHIPTIICLLRNTPTCVGKTVLTSNSTTNFRKHPHMRGEDSPCGLARAYERETPPHAWGRPMRKLQALVRHRNTPTCVGKTCLHPLELSDRRKHPHMRGEDLRI